MTTLDNGTRVRRPAKKSTTDRLGEMLGDAITWIALTFIDAALLMLGADMIHNGWIPAVPTLGYWWAVGITVSAVYLSRRIFGGKR